MELIDATLREKAHCFALTCDCRRSADLEVETGIQATGATGVNNVESSQGEDRAIVLYDESRQKDLSACKALVLSEALDKPETMPVRVMNDSDDELTLTEIARIEWSSEDDFCSAFYTDSEICLNAVCAWYRQQISGNKVSSMSKIDKNRITALGVFLCRDDPEKKLKRTISEVGLEDLCICKTLAIRYSRQIYRIYNSKKDQLFRPGVGIRK
ncbi:hypothetical protein CQW23_18417 [Capsicum baccatum]|uniref:Uncharacterized protein n=1 Tax=Capsicum baccatum TaxID=33114 RepID=A0A2G2W2Y5_CAPBA|nr:hypothetical protein CQW23_18417 [Capsicum baccatum]